MKKKIVSLLTAAMLVMSMGTVAFAAGSPSAGQVSDVTKNPSQEATVEKPATKTPESYVESTTASGSVKKADGSYEQVETTVSAVSKDTVDTTAKEVETQLKDVENVADVIDSPELKEAAKDSTKKIVPEIKTVVNVSAEGVEVSEENPITLTISADVNAGDDILVLHWNGTAWETIKPDAVQNGSVVVTLTSLSPVAIVKLSVEDADKTPGGNQDSQKPGSGDATGNTTGNTTGSAAGTSTGTATSTKTTGSTTTSTKTTGATKTSPKTGMETSAMPIIALAFAAAGLACAKRAKSN